MRFRPLGVATWAALLLSCGGTFMPRDDGFGARVEVIHLSSLDDCRALKKQALARTENCDGPFQPTCADAQKDFARVGVRCSSLEEQEAARQADERAKRRAAVERQKLDQEIEQDRLKYEDQERIARWVQAAIAACASGLTRSPCASEAQPKDIDHEARANCTSGCLRAIEGAKDVLVSNAVAACVAKVADSDGKASPVCDLQTPPGATESLNDRADACSKECADQAIAVLSRKRALRATQAAPTSSPARPAAPASQCGGMARCCDGQCSPSCACPGHRGCCSHHGGLCGC